MKEKVASYFRDAIDGGKAELLHDLFTHNQESYKKAQPLDSGKMDVPVFSYSPVAIELFRIIKSKDLYS